MLGKPRVVLYGAAGHTGRFVAAEIARRGWTPLLTGRDMAKLKPVADRHGAEARQVEVMDAAGLDRLLVGADAVINCAGPFGDTAPPLIERSEEHTSALQSLIRISYAVFGLKKN